MPCIVVVVDILHQHSGAENLNGRPRDVLVNLQLKMSSFTSCSNASPYSFVIPAFSRTFPGSLDKFQLRYRLVIISCVTVFSLGALRFNEIND